MERPAPRRAQVTMMLLAGLSLKEIAQRLKRSRRTIESHREAIYRKYGCDSRIGLMWAVAARQEEDEMALNPR